MSFRKLQPEYLNRIGQISHRLRQLVRSKYAARPWVTKEVKATTKPISLTLPYPRPITATLVALGIELKYADVLSRIHLKHALRLKRVCEERMERVAHVWHSTAGGLSDLSSVRSIFEKHYQHSLENAKEEIVGLTRRHVLELASQTYTSANFANEKNTSFKHEATPILEEFYLCNPYPSREDKEVLAEKTQLQKRQINVWFQNRRARAKRNGQEVRRTPEFVGFVERHFSDIPSTFVSEMDHLINESLNPVKPSYPTNSLDFTFPKYATRISELCCLEAPEHAFPSPFKSECVKDAFPVVDGLGYFDIPWPREASTFPSERPSVPEAEVSNMIAAFSKLSLGNDDSCARRPETTFVRLLLSVAQPSARSPAFTMPRKSSKASVVLSLTTAAAQKDSLSDEPVRRLPSASKCRLSARASLQKVCHPYASGTPAPSACQSHPQSRPSSRFLDSFSKRAPRTLPQFAPHRPRSSRSSSLTSVSSDDSSSSGASVADLVTPPTPTFELPSYFTSEKKQKRQKRHSPYPHIDYSRLEKSACAPRTFQFRTTIAAF